MAETEAETKARQYKAMYFFKIYMMVMATVVGIVSFALKDRIIEGARKRGAPEAYITFLIYSVILGVITVVVGGASTLFFGQGNIYAKEQESGASAKKKK